MTRDKQKISKVRQTLWLGVVLVVAVASLGNMAKQIYSVIRAKSENLALDGKISRLENREIDLMAKIKIATSVAYIDQEIHDKFGLGGVDDYRIVIPKDYDFSDLYPKMNIGDQVPYWKQWWNWIAHKAPASGALL